MSNEVQLVSDGDGVAVIGTPAAVDLFLALEGLASTNLGLKRLGAVFGVGARVAQAAPEMKDLAGRWVELTKESKQLVEKHGLKKSSVPGLETAVVEPGKSAGRFGDLMGIAKNPVSQQLSNPAVLSGAAGLMAQLAMQQAMDEVTNYLERIDEKLDDVLRAQEDGVHADLIGVGFDINEAMTLREHGGRVNEVTWSKVQGSSSAIARTQAYALRQLDAVADKLERKSKLGDLAETTKAAEAKAQGWLAVLARTFQLQDAVAVLELDRVAEVDATGLDAHRLGLKASRRKRLESIAEVTERLMIRVKEAASTANSKVLLNPIQSPAVVQSSENVARALADFHSGLGVESGHDLMEARAWADAATEFRGKVFDTGAEGLDASLRLGNETLDRAKVVTGRLSSGISSGISGGIAGLRRRGQEPAPDQPEA